MLRQAQQPRSVLPLVFKRFCAIIRRFFETEEIFSMMRKEFCEKDGILITYTENDVCFEECSTARAVLLRNDGTVIHSNFDSERDAFFKEYLKKIYPAITTFRSLDSLESA